MTHDEARQIFQAAFLRGEVKRLACERCGDPYTQAHHTNYAEPLTATRIVRELGEEWGEPCDGGSVTSALTGMKRDNLAVDAGTRKSKVWALVAALPAPPSGPSVQYSLYCTSLDTAEIVVPRRATSGANGLGSPPGTGEGLAAEVSP